MKPAQYKSAYVGVWTRWVGKLAEVGAVPCGAASGAALSLDWAQTAVARIATNNINGPVFFMLPPGMTAKRPLPSQMPEKKGFSRKVTRGYGRVKVTRVSGVLGKKFSAIFLGKR